MPSHPYAKKSLGQHFLRHAHICERIVHLIQACDEDWILEIGPGPGALTQVLARAPHARLVLVEKDVRFAEERQRSGDGRTQAILMDALRFPWAKLTSDRPWKLIGNLPYNVASPLLWDMAVQCRGMLRAAFMVQKEVGQRLAAQPGSRHYGALSIWIQSFWQPRMEFVVGPGAFSPPPKVDSAVLSFLPLAEAQRPEQPDTLARLIKVCFQQRRKQLGSIARRASFPLLFEALEAVGIGPTLRPEQLSVAEFHALSVAWHTLIGEKKAFGSVV